jgi:hypothetical protein
MARRGFDRHLTLAVAAARIAAGETTASPAPSGSDGLGGGGAGRMR